MRPVGVAAVSAGLVAVGGVIGGAVGAEVCAATIEAVNEAVISNVAAAPSNLGAKRGIMAILTCKRGAQVAAAS
jgi:hypothetical protein